MLGSLQELVITVLAYAAFALAVYALVDVVRRRPEAFVGAGKQTKTLWASIVGVATAITFVALPRPLGVGFLGLFNFVTLAAVTASIIYIVGVKPALGPHRKGRGQRPSRHTGGW